MPGPSWSFEKLTKKLVRRDAFEAEFFTGEEESDEVYGRIDALVRESIQNSLDASRNKQQVHVRFSLSEQGVGLDATRSAPYLTGLPRHMSALGNDMLSELTSIPAMSFLAIEDFGTRGLTGDISLNQDPEGPMLAENPESFYWFWRNIGRSGKSGHDRGRWGLGKTVFPATSRINAMYGLTIRASDGKALLMGQAVTKVHRLEGSEYVPEGFFNDPDLSEEIQFPVEDPAIIEKFCEDFRLERKGRSGLSIVVPYPFRTVRGQDIIQSVIVHWFIPILRGDLVVAVEAPDIVGTVTISEGTIQAVSAGVLWKGKKTERKHAPPPFDFARAAIQLQQQKKLRLLDNPEREKVPQWSDARFPGETLQELRLLYDRYQMIAVQVPITLKLKDGSLADSTFDLFLQRDENIDQSEDIYTREGMTVPKVTSLSGTRGNRAILMVEHGELSQLLGDTEGPAHTTWGTGESRPDRSFQNWKGRVDFVKKSPARLMSLLAPPAEGVDEDWLVDIFNIEEPNQTGPRRRIKKPGPKPGRDPNPADTTPPPPPTRPSFVVVQTQGGFRIRLDPNAEAIPAKISVSVAYDLTDGLPLSNYHPLDFRFDANARRETRITLVHRDVEFLERKNNRLVFVPQSRDFEVEASGFRTVSGDLYIRAEERQAEA